MQPSDQNLIKKGSFSSTGPEEPSTKNFWESDNYCIPLKRIEYSSKLLSELKEMFQELSSLEARFGKSLTVWSEKWFKSLSQQEEAIEDDCFLFGSHKEAIMDCINSVAMKGKAHIQNWSDIHSHCVTPLAELHEKNFQKGFSHLNQAKEIKEDFKTAQQPFLETYQKYRDASLKYSAHHDSFGGQAPNSIEKCESNIAELKKNPKKESRRKMFEERKEQLELLIPHYTKRMKEIYSRCNDFERTKLQTIRMTLDGMHDVHTMARNPNNDRCLKMQKNSLAIFDVETDLKRWGDLHGPVATYDFMKVEPVKKSKMFRLKTFHPTKSKSLSLDVPAAAPQTSESKTEEITDDPSTL